MKHQIPVETLGPMGPHMAGAVEACVHCGFCLPTCPTYQLLGQEMDSPRGRIVLMKEVLENNLSVAEAAPHLDPCLGCLACETACPSGVSYRGLLGPYRSLTRERRPVTVAQRRVGQLVAQTLPYPRRFRWAAILGALARRLRLPLPAPVRPMLDLLPEKLPRPQPLPPLTRARGGRRARVALHAGCAQQVLAPEIGRAAVDLLSENGVEVVVPGDQACCGSLAWHSGDLPAARRFAQLNLDAFLHLDVDAVITTAAGCGSGMHEYGIILAGSPDANRAAALAEMTVDVATFLHQIGPVAAQGFTKPVKVAYQDPCHLLHGQGVASAPRQLLAAVPNLELVEVGDATTCCGSAGTYNIDQPDLARELGRRKAARILETGAQWAASGNIGCLMQIRQHLPPPPKGPRVLHTVEVLRAALRPGA